VRARASAGEDRIRLPTAREAVGALGAPGFSGAKDCVCFARRQRGGAWILAATELDTTLREQVIEGRLGEHEALAG